MIPYLELTIPWKERLDASKIEFREEISHRDGNRNWISTIASVALPAYRKLGHLF
jgi:hypothetical protein